MSENWTEAWSTIGASDKKFLRAYGSRADIKPIQVDVSSLFTEHWKNGEMPSLKNQPYVVAWDGTEFHGWRDANKWVESVVKPMVQAMVDAQFAAEHELMVENLVYSLLAEFPATTIAKRRSNAKRFSPSILEAVKAEIARLLEREAEA